jgi:malonate-semialdehyde dehydrogenase (acetylating) / methylmalonate-semialdehyde dehydrogenase
MLNLSSFEKIKCDNFVNGSWVVGQKENVQITSPWSGQVLGEISVPSSTQITEALTSAHHSFKTWSRAPIKERSQVLYNFRNILIRDQEKIARVVAAES